MSPHIPPFLEPVARVLSLWLLRLGQGSGGALPAPQGKEDLVLWSMPALLLVSILESSSL